MNRLTTLITAAAVIASPMALAATTAHAAPDSARKPAAYTVTAKANKQVVTVGEDVVKVRGKVTPRAAGDKVVLQQRLDGRKKWSVSGEVKIKRNGTFVATDKPSVPGTRQYRVVKPASDGVKKGTSAIVDVQVYAWQKLAQRPRGANENIAVSSTATHRHPGLPVLLPALHPRCAVVRRVHAGTPLHRPAHDLRAERQLGHRRLGPDHARRRRRCPRSTRCSSVGQVVESTTDLTGAFRLRYELASNASPASYPVVATPEVRCTK